MTLPPNELEALKREVFDKTDLSVSGIIDHLTSTGRLLPEWQPIETAPKDGKSFLVHTPDNNCTYQVYRRPDAGDKFLSWISGNDLEKHQAVKFTHWMPLPQPPAAKGE